MKKDNIIKSASNSLFVGLPIILAAFLAIYFAWLKNDSNRLGRELDSLNKELQMTHTVINNLEGEKASYTARRHVMKKVRDFKLHLSDPEPGQVRYVRHFPEHPDSPLSIEEYQAQNRDKFKSDIVVLEK